MSSITLSIDEQLKLDIKGLSWVNWSEMAKEELLKDLGREKAMQELDELFKNSKLTDEDILEWSKKARKGRFKELKSKGLV